MTINERVYGGFRRTTGDATGAQLALLLPTDYRVLHLASAADHATDWGVANPTHPTFYVHSETTPSTDYLSLAHNGDNGVLTLSGGGLSISGSGVHIGDSANANLTVGVSINQGANDDQILALKSSDVVTGASTLPLSAFDIETDDYFVIGKIDGGTGGTHMVSIIETAQATGMAIESWSGAPATTDTSSSLGAMTFFVGQHDDANADADMASNSNAFVWGEIDSSAARQTRMILKADDGELHLDNTTLQAFDNEDDAQLIRAMQKAGSSSGIIETQYDNPFYDYDRLHELGLAGEKDAKGVFLFPLQSRLSAHEGAIWQGYVAGQETRQVLEDLSVELRGKIAEVDNRLFALTDGK